MTHSSELLFFLIFGRSTGQIFLQEVSFVRKFNFPSNKVTFWSVLNTDKNLLTGSDPEKIFLQPKKSFFGEEPDDAVHF